MLVVPILLGVVAIAGLWATFAKAGQPGWALLVPVYNLLVLMNVAKRPGWWVLLCLVPVVNLAVFLTVTNDIARHFGKGAGFGLGLAFLGFIFWPILGFGPARYLSRDVDIFA